MCSARRGVLIAVMLSGAATASAQTPAPFEPGQQCVAYSTTKRVALVRTVRVVGRNCDVDARVTRLPAGLARLEVAVAVRGFDSGDRRRDRDVAAILEADRHPQIRFRTGSIEEASLRRLLAGDTVRVAGTLDVAGRSHPISFRLHPVVAGGSVIRGTAETSFSELGIEVPRVGPGGMVADPRDGLTLLVQLDLDRVPGADGVRR